MSETGREIHGRAEIAREKEQNFEKALGLLEEAFDQYIKEKDYLGAAESRASASIVFKHKYQKSGDHAYLIRAKEAAIASVDLARLSDQKEALALPLFNLGKIYFEMKDWEDAKRYYQEATETPLMKLHDRPAVKLDMQGHLYAAEYMAGDKYALEKAIVTAEELEKTHDDSKYEKDVWQSGAYLRIAAMQKFEGNQGKAIEYLDKARQIIDSNEELKLRRGQLETVEKIVNG